MLSLGFCYFTVLIDIDVSRFLLNVPWQRRPKRIVFYSHFNYFATLYSGFGKKTIFFCKPKAHIYSEKGHCRESRYLMLNLPLFTVVCLNKRFLKLENSIMTLNPQVFEMEQQDFVLKKNMRCALGSLFIPWCYLDSKKKKKKKAFESFLSMAENCRF